VRAQGGDRRTDVAHAEIDVEALEEAEGALEIGLAIPEIDVRFEPPEQIGHENDVALFGVPCRDVAHDGIDPEDLLAEHEARTGPARGQGEERVERARTVGRTDGNHRTAHVRMLARPRRNRLSGWCSVHPGGARPNTRTSSALA
jgi:hypothetical protein